MAAWCLDLKKILTAHGAADVLSPEVICLKRPYEINFLSFGMAFDHSPAALTSSHAFVYDSMFGSVSEDGRRIAGERL